MTLRQWIVGLFRKRSTSPAVNADAHVDHRREHQRVLDERAADATRIAESGINS